MASTPVLRKLSTLIRREELIPLSGSQTPHLRKVPPKSKTSTCTSAQGRFMRGLLRHGQAVFQIFTRDLLKIGCPAKISRNHQIQIARPVEARFLRAA